MNKTIILKLSDVMPKQMPHNSVRERSQRQGHSVDLELRNRCWQAWNNLSNVRATRERIKNYCYGDQWGDTVKVWEKGCWQEMTEREYLKMKGNVPLTNNIMSSILISVVGLYARQGTEPVCFARSHDAQWLSDMMSATMQCNWQNTQMENLLKSAMEEYLIGGVLVARETYEDREQDILDAWTDIIDPNYVFFEGGSDSRHLDLSLIGVLHDVSREDLYKKFARPEYNLTIDDLNDIFDITDIDEGSTVQLNDINALSNVSFDIPSRKGHYVRVIEAWSTETKYRYQCYDPIATSESDAYFRIDAEDQGMINQLIAKNEKRMQQYEMAGTPEEDRAYITSELIADKYWFYTYMAPDGTVLCQGETPYDYKSHPFTIKLYPYTNSEIHPFMGTPLDQQRYINRLIIMNDMAIRSSAKGLMMIPKNVIPDNMTPEQFAEQITEYDGLVFYEPKKSMPNVRPDVVMSNAVNIGTNELLQIELNLIRDVTNVSGAIQGKTPSAGTSATRYAQEAQNATTSLYTILKDMEVFTENVANKKCMTIKQFYDDGRMIFNQDFTQQMDYDRMAARDVKFKISIKNAAATASYQTQINDQLDRLLQMGAINLVQYLQNVNAPFADKLLQSVQNQQAQLQTMAEQQQAAGAVQQGADMQSVQQAQQYLTQQ